jgi:hypothetical protein
MFSPLVCRGFDAPANVSLLYSIRSGVWSGSWSRVKTVEIGYSTKCRSDCVFNLAQAGLHRFEGFAVSSEQPGRPPSAFSVSFPLSLGGLRPRSNLEQSLFRLKCLRPGSPGLLE